MSVTDSNDFHVKPPAQLFLADIDYMTEELSEEAKINLSEDESVRIQSLKLLRSMLAREVGLSWQDDDLFLLAFLRVRKYDINKAFCNIKTFYEALGKHGQVYYNLNFGYLRRIIEENSLYMLPYRDYEGCVVVCFSFRSWNSDIITAKEYMVCFSLGLMEALRSPSTQIAGFRFIADFKNLSRKQLMNLTPTVVIFLVEILKNLVPCRVRRIHLLNESYFWIFKQIVKPFVSKKVLERVQFHGKDVKSLHRFVHPSILPTDFGGEMPFDNADWLKRMEDASDYITHLLSFGYEKYLKKDYRKFSQ